MANETEMPSPVPRPAAKRRRDGPLRAAWRSVRQPLVQSPLVKRMLTSLITNALWLIRRTNPLVKGETNGDGTADFSIDVAGHHDLDGTSFKFA